MAEFLEQLGRLLEEAPMKADERMANHTMSHIGGPVDYHVTPKNVGELSAVMQLCRQEQMSYYVIENGDSLLVSDNGYWSVIIAMTDSLGSCQIDGARVAVGAGIRPYRLARRAEGASPTDFEFAAGTPGTLGGALVVNAGIYGSGMKNILISADVLGRDRRILTLTTEKLELGYRHSCASEKGYLVLSDTFEPSYGESASTRETIEELSRKGRERQPLEYPSAGSIFGRPEGHSTGKSTEEAGLHGSSADDAQATEKHYDFVINRNRAIASDIRNPYREVVKRVKEHSGAGLGMEVKILGDIE